MDELLPHYERELAFLRTRASDFARRYPKIAGRLQLSGDVGDDPHVERLMESFALLTSRVHKRLDDDFPLFTESLLEVLYPHYLRPFPSCSIAHFDVGASAGQMSKAIVVERGTQLSSRPVKGATCKFRTTQDALLLPLKVAEVTFKSAVNAPPGSADLLGATSVLSIRLENLSSRMAWNELLGHPIRFYLDGEASQVSALREALCGKSLGLMTQLAVHRPWFAAPQSPSSGGRSLPMLSGFADDEAMLDWELRANPAYRLLTEYFAFPEKFNFVSIPALAGDKASVPAATEQEGAPRDLIVHVLFHGIRADSDEARLLETVSSDNFVLGAAPVINLFRQPADPIRISHRDASYPVVVDGRKAYAYEVYSLDRVFRVRQTPNGDAVDEVRPFFSLRHDDVLQGDALCDEPTGRALPGMGKAPGVRSSSLAYWQMHRDEDLGLQSPGHEVSITLVDAAFNPALLSVDTLSLDVSATNRDLPQFLTPGTVGGDLFSDGGGPARQIRLLRKPTATCRFERGRGVLWRLISHLSLNHLSLTGGGVDALKEILRLYDLPRSATNRRQVDGVVGIAFQPSTAWLPGEPFATFVRGTEVRLTVDEGSFVGTGLGLFAAVLDRFLGLYVHANSFTKLTLVSSRTQEELLSCPPRNGDLQLL